MLMPYRASILEHSLRLQGRLYCALVLLTLLVLAYVAPLPDVLLHSSGSHNDGEGGTGLILLTIALFLLGIPHGALDTVYATRKYGVSSIGQWLVFSLAYLVPAALVILLWRLAPTVFLPGFLLISMMHFSGDPGPRVPLACSIVYGGAIIFLPAVLHAQAVTNLFAYLVPGEVAVVIVRPMQMMGWGWTGAVVIAVAYLAKSNRTACLELACTGMLALFASPLLAFTIFFCAMHSLRHILKTAHQAERPTLSLLLRAASLPTLACLLAFCAALYWHHDIWLDARIMQYLFVGLAALTVPHMLLVDRDRWSRGMD